MTVQELVRRAVRRPNREDRRVRPAKVFRNQVAADTVVVLFAVTPMRPGDTHPTAQHIDTQTIRPWRYAGKGRRAGLLISAQYCKPLHETWKFTPGSLRTAHAVCAPPVTPVIWIETEPRAVEGT